jgi:hypothetical protein
MMPNLKYSSPFDAYKETGDGYLFFKQFKTAVPQLNHVYKVVGAGIIVQQVKIIAFVDKVAIGKVIADDCANACVGEISMYNMTGIAIGWRYGDTRSGYRLQGMTL